MPLLIGGATTSAKHTAVKIAPCYHETGRPRQGRLALRRRRRSADAARERKPSSTARTAPSRRSERESFAQRRAAQARALRRGRAHAASRSTGQARRSPTPAFLGRAGAARLPAGRDRAVHRLVAVLHGLGAEGQVPADLRRPDRRQGGPRAVRQRQAAAATRSSTKKLLTAHAVYGFFPANADGDDIIVYTDEHAHARSVPRFHMLRQQWEREGQTTSAAWPTTSPRSTAGVADYLGAFAVTAGFGAEELVQRVQDGPRRLQRHHGRGAGRPPGRGVRRAAARARPPRLGLRPGRTAHRRTT